MTIAIRADLPNPCYSTSLFARVERYRTEGAVRGSLSSLLHDVEQELAWRSRVPVQQHAEDEVRFGAMESDEAADYEALIEHLDGELNRIEDEWNEWLKRAQDAIALPQEVHA